MNRDGRGRAVRVNVKHNQPKLKLVDVLRRRRTTLKNLLSELGITTYASLDIWCGRLGVVCPTLAEFELVMPPSRRINSPHEGVIVLEPPPTIDEKTGANIDVEDLSSLEPQSMPTEQTGSLLVEPVKRKRSKKEDASQGD